MHKRIHAGVMLYRECAFYKDTFNNKKDLIRHTSVNTEEPFNVKYVTFNKNSDLKNHTRVQIVENPYPCDFCQKSYAQNVDLSRHYKTAAHITRIKSKNTNLPYTQSSFVDCDKSIKKDIKEEIKEEESVDDPSSLIYSTESYIKEEIKEEVDEGQSVDDPIPMAYSTEGSVMQGIEEEVKEPNGEHSVENSNLDTDNLVDCSEYVQVQMNFPKIY